jgi:ATP-binding cassette subfamily F protein uup
VGTRIGELHAALAEHSADYERLLALGVELEQAVARQDDLEAEWLELAERLGD